MILTKALTNFTNYTEGNLSLLSATVLLAMNNNPYFLTPVPALPVLQASTDDFNASVAAAAGRDRTRIAEKNASKSLLQAMLSQTAQYVNTISQGDPVKINSSGFPQVKVRVPIILGEPQNISAKPSINSGSLVSKVKAVKGASAYIHYIAEGPLTEATVWKAVNSSRCKNMFTNLEPGKTYWVKVAAVGSNGQMTLSNEISQIVI